MYDYQYVNQADPFYVVKLDLDGRYVIIGGDDLDTETLAAMANMDDVQGWTVESL